MPKSCIQTGGMPSRRDAMRPLVEHLEPHVLEHRQAVGQRHRRAEVEELEAQRAGRAPRAGGRGDIAERLGGGQPRHHLRCRAPRRARRNPRGSRRETRRRTARNSSLPRASPSASISAPLAGRRPSAAPRRRAAPRARARRTSGIVPGVVRTVIMDARQHRFGQVHVELGARAVERLHQDRLPLLPQLGRVVLARRVDEARRRSARTDRAARTGGSAAGRPDAGCPSPCAAARPRWSGTARRADRLSRMLISALPAWLPGAQARARDDVRRSCAAAAECRPDWRCRRST